MSFLTQARLGHEVRGKNVVVTGASDGIGAHLSKRLGEAGARVILVARSPEKLQAIGDMIREAGGEAFEYRADLSCVQDAQRAIDQVLEDHGHVDIVISNAGRSIRRSVKYQRDRFHDFERLMALNYFGALKVILGVLPGMRARGAGHIIHVSSFGVPTRQTRFAGYIASKSALDTALQSVAGEVSADGVRMSSVYMPLVKTKMTEAPGHSYDVHMLSLDQACDLVGRAIVWKEREVLDLTSRFLQWLYFFSPSMMVFMNWAIYSSEGEKQPDDYQCTTLRSQRQKERQQERNTKPKTSSKCQCFSPKKMFACLLNCTNSIGAFLEFTVVLHYMRDFLLPPFVVAVLLVRAVCVLVYKMFACVRWASSRAFAGKGSEPRPPAADLEAAAGDLDTDSDCSEEWASELETGSSSTAVPVSEREDTAEMQTPADDLEAGVCTVQAAAS